MAAPLIYVPEASALMPHNRPRLRGLHRAPEFQRYESAYTASWRLFPSRQRTTSCLCLLHRDRINWDSLLVKQISKKKPIACESTNADKVWSLVSIRMHVCTDLHEIAMHACSTMLHAHLSNNYCHKCDVMDNFSLIPRHHGIFRRQAIIMRTQARAFSHLLP
jgi:hypothetical protein